VRSLWGIYIIAALSTTGGTLIAANLDLGALGGLDRVFCWFRIFYRGFTGYRVKPPKGFGRNVLTAEQLTRHLVAVGFRVSSAERIDYVRAVKL
jgi:hypothetical protein